MINPSEERYVQKAFPALNMRCTPGFLSMRGATADGSIEVEVNATLHLRFECMHKSSAGYAWGYGPTVRAAVEDALKRVVPPAKPTPRWTKRQIDSALLVVGKRESDLDQYAKRRALASQDNGLLTTVGYGYKSRWVWTEAARRAEVML